VNVDTKNIVSFCDSNCITDIKIYRVKKSEYLPKVKNGNVRFYDFVSPLCSLSETIIHLCFFLQNHNTPFIFLLHLYYNITTLYLYTVMFWFFPFTCRLNEIFLAIMKSRLLTFIIKWRRLYAVIGKTFGFLLNEPG